MWVQRAVIVLVLTLHGIGGGVPALLVVVDVDGWCCR